jgi:hypothetical protein
MPSKAPGGDKYEAAFTEFQTAVAPILGQGVEIPPGLQAQMAGFIAAAEALAAIEQVPLPEKRGVINAGLAAQKRGILNRTVAGVKRETDTLKGIYSGNDGTLNFALSSYLEAVAKKAGISLGVGTGSAGGGS